MDILLIVGIVALIVLLVVVYPRLQEQRDRELAEKLQEIKDPTVAMLEADRVMGQYQHETKFFKPRNLSSPSV